MELILKLNEKEIETIRTGLGELPARISHNLINKIDLQLSNQIKQGQISTMPVKAKHIE